MTEIAEQATVMTVLDNAINDLHELLKNKDSGVGVIRIDEYGDSIAEYYSSSESLKENVDMKRNLVIVHVEDNMPRRDIRRACLFRLKIMVEQKRKENES